ncbi:nucleotidyltransferase family protein [Mucilaginibacter sp.]
MLSIAQLQSAYNNEQTLIILLARLYFGTQNVKEVGSFLTSNAINWPAFYQSVSVNNIRGFVYDVVSVNQIPVDAPTFDKLKKDAETITRQNFYQFKLTRQLLTEFEQLGVAIIAYKGMALAGKYYRQPFLRESTDIDFLVDKGSVERIRSHLYQLGYRSKFDAADRYLSYLISHHKELSFRPPPHPSGLNCSVEIQWQLLEHYFDPFPDFSFFAPQLAEHLSDKNTGLSPTHDFICTASHHLIKEPLWKFKNLVDLACMIQAADEQLNWPFIHQVFKKYGYAGFLFSGLTALSEVLGIAQGHLQFPQARYSLFKAGRYSNQWQDYMQLWRIIGAHQSPGQRVRFNTKALYGLLQPNLNDLKLARLPAWAVPLLIPLKPFRLMYERLITKKIKKNK